MESLISFKINKLPLLSLWAGVLFFAISGCSPDSNRSGKTVFRYNEASGITSLDPAYARGQADTWACNQLFNGLVQMNDALEVQPCIANSWDISPDGLTYTFALRTDVLFHDDPSFPGGKGRKVTAADFVYSFSRLTDAAVASPGSWVMNMVADDSATLSGKAVYAIASDTLIIQLKQPFPPFLGILTSQYCSVVPKEAIALYGKSFRTHPVGTGPFIFHEWYDRTNLIYWRNPSYFEKENGEALPFVDAVSISFISDRQSAFLEFIKGNLDFVSGIDASYKDEVLTRSGHLQPRYEKLINLETCAYLNTEYLGILADSSLESMQNNPLNDIRIRKAINYGFDRKKMIAYLRNNIGTPGTAGITPPGLPSFDTSSVKGYSYYPELSLSLLAQAGFPNGKGLPIITLSTTKEYQDLCEFMQGQLSEIGIRIKLEINPGATHREMVAKQKLPFFRASWIADYPDAESYFSLFYAPNKAPDGPNYTHFASPEYDALYKLASRSVKDSIRYGYYHQMDQLIVDQAPVVILYYDQVIRLTSKSISGLGNNGMNLLTLKRVRKNN